MFLELEKLQEVVKETMESFELNNVKLDVRLAIDASGSMHDEFQSGWVDNIVNVFMAAAMRFDDNGKMPVAAFNTSLVTYEDATIHNLDGYVNSQGIVAGGGTCFGPVISGMTKKAKVGFLKKFFNNSATVEMPIYLGIVTDGQPSDSDTVLNKLREIDSSTYIHFFGVGNDVPVEYMESLVKSHQRVAFTHFASPMSATPELMYRAMAQKLKSWNF